jgi:hypothetical protein
VRGGRIISKGFNHYRRTPHSACRALHVNGLLLTNGLVRESSMKRSSNSLSLSIFNVRRLLQTVVDLTLFRMIPAQACQRMLRWQR